MGLTHRHHLALKSNNPQPRLLRVVLFILALFAVFFLNLWLCSRLNFSPLDRLENELPSVLAFCLGLFVLLLLYAIIWGAIKLLHCAGGTKNEPEVEPLALSRLIALFEQLLFYIAAVAGAGVFKYAVGGWLVFKSVNKYARWEKPPAEPSPEERARFIGAYSEYLKRAAIAHNRFQIFAIGTAMSIAAGGIAGATYHLALHLVKNG